MRLGCLLDHFRQPHEVGTLWGREYQVNSRGRVQVNLQVS